MNRRDFSEITAAFPDITTSNTPPSRGAAYLDMLASNIEDCVTKVALFPPLKTDTGQESDHSVILSTYVVEKRVKSTWMKYRARKRTDEGKETF